MDLTIEHPADSDSVVHITLEDDESDDVLRDAIALSANAGAAPTWVHGSTAQRDAVMSKEGFVSSRSLLQMRVALPVAPSGMLTRRLELSDIDPLIEVNNRAFAWHPEQSGLTRSKFEADMAKPWFDRGGIRLFEAENRLAGFCWTKVHSEPEELGEIYVIALDPDFHGRGLGTAMTLAGLEWLSDLDLDTAMLFVESDNDPAVGTYRRIGFGVHRIDKLWSARR